MIFGATGRPTGTQLRLLGALAILVAFGCWAIASPVGASPDEDFHLASIWCAHGTQAGICEPGPTATSRMVPAQLLQDRCYAFHPETSAACQPKPPAADEMVSTDRGNFDGLYPPVFYWFEGLFVSHDVGSSVLAMRIANALLFVGLVAALYLLLPPGLRRAMVGASIVTVVPLGMFIVPSINPSSWGFLAAATFFVAVAGFLRAEDRRRRIGLGVLAALSFLLGAGSRADAPMFALVAIAAAVILTVRFDRRSLRRLVLPAVLAVIAVPAFLSAGQSSHADAATATAPFSLSRLLYVALDVPSLWTGGLGGWGLGWLDTNMRPIVSVGAWAVFVGVGFVALGGAGGRRGLAAVGVVALAAFAIPTYVQYLTGYSVGNIVQPRYILPLLTILAATVMIRIEGTTFRLTHAQRWIVVASLSVANAVALHDNIRRYVTGTDVTGQNLNRNVEWWWSIPLSPMATWAIGAVVFALGLVLLTREFTTAEASMGEARVRHSAGDEPGRRVARRGACDVRHDGDGRRHDPAAGRCSHDHDHDHPGRLGDLVGPVGGDPHVG